MYAKDVTSATITIKPERCHEVTIRLFPHSTAELVKHDPDDSANTWYSLLVDGRHYRLVMAKFTHGRPEITEALNQARAEVQKTIGALQAPAPANHPTITKRVGEYDPATRQYPAYVAIDGEPEQLVGIRWSVGAADTLCDEYIFNYYADRHTPEAAARIALAFAPEDTPYCFFHPNATDHDTRHCPRLDEPGFGEPSYSVFN